MKTARPSHPSRVACRFQILPHGRKPCQDEPYRHQQVYENTATTQCDAYHGRSVGPWGAAAPRLGPRTPDGPRRLFARLSRGFRPECVSFLPLRGVSFTPRASSGRSGWASSPALRPVCARDRAGSARLADPRCSPPSHETLGQGQRLHGPVWPLGTRTLRRDGSRRPRGGLTPTHPLGAASGAMVARTPGAD